jgi:hypothetical protein
MPKNHFWDISVKIGQKSKKKFFGNSLHIAVYKKAIKPQKYCLTKLIFKKLVF